MYFPLEELLQIEDADPGAGPSSVAVSDEDVASNSTDIFTDNNDEDHGQGERIPKWSSLPDITVAKIASYLKPWEKGRMAITCRNWHGTIISSPQLWRSAEMSDFNDFEHVIYAKSVGRYLKKLYIYGGGRRSSQFQRTFSAMLHSLYRQGPVQLTDFAVKDLQFQNKFGNNNSSYTRKGIIRSLNRFLRCQTNLERLDLSCATLTLNEGLSLIHSASDRSRAKLKYLYLDDFFEREAAISVGTEFISAISRFQGLLELILNYGFVSDQLLTRLGESCQKSLEYIHIRTHRWDLYQHSVDASCWHEIRQCIPRLRVKFTLNGITKINDLQRLLVTSMPLESVHIYSYDDDGYHPDRTAKHLARHYYDTLRNVVIDIGPVAYGTVFRSYNSGLINLVTDCKILQSLEIHGRVAWPILRDIFEHIDDEYLKKNLAPSLTKLQFVLTCSGPQEEPEVLLVMEEFRPRFAQHNLDYDVTEDLIYSVPMQ